MSVSLVPPVAPDALPAVTAALRQPDLTPRHRERLEVVKGAMLGWDVPALCAWSGRSPRTVRRVLTRYAAGGLAALPDAPRAGRPPKVDATYRQALNAAMAQAPRDVGLARDGWTSARLSEYLARETGVTVSPGWLRTVLHQEGWRVGRPKHSVAHRQDPTALAACKARLQAVGEKGGGCAGPV